MHMYTLDEISIEEFKQMLTRSGQPPERSKRFWEDQRWIIEHIAELVREYPDQWVMVYNKQVVAASPDLGVAKERAFNRVGDKEIASIFVEGKNYVF